MYREKAKNLAKALGLVLDLSELDDETITIEPQSGHCFGSGGHSRVISYAGPGYRKELWFDVYAELEGFDDDWAKPVPCNSETCDEWRDGGCAVWDE